MSVYLFFFCHQGNAGDSRAIAKVGDRVVALSKDHKPMDEDEYLRIVQAGGYVDMNRVNGNLALSRALGDFNFKNNPQLPPERQIVTGMLIWLASFSSTTIKFQRIFCCYQSM